VTAQQIHAREKLDERWQRLHLLKRSLFDRQF